jgi:hypothetical protein
MQLTMSARKSGSKLREVREMGLGQPKKMGKKSALFLILHRKCKKQGMWVLWCIHPIDVPGPLFYTVISVMMY